MPGKALKSAMAGRMLPPAATSMPKRRRRSWLASAAKGVLLPAQMTKMMRRGGAAAAVGVVPVPGWADEPEVAAAPLAAGAAAARSRSTTRWMPPVKSVTCCGRYSSCTMVAWRTAARKAATPSRPKA